MKEKDILYKTSIGNTPYIFWVLFCLAIILCIIYISLNVTLFLVIISILLLCIFFTSTKEILVRDDSFEVNSNIFFNIIEKKGRVFYFSDVNKVELRDSRWTVDFDFPFFPYIKGKELTISFHDKKKEIKEIKEINLRKNDIKKAVDLINKKLGKNG